MSEILAASTSSTQVTQLAQFTAMNGHNLVVASNVAKTKELMQQRHPELVVAPIDFEYGEILSLVRWAKAQPDMKSIQFILWTETKHSQAPAQEHSLRLAARALGADKFVALPEFHAAELWWQIAVMLPGGQS
jgi:CheY-like chemotaxis protein